jgi:hypothetical protein
MKNKIQQKIYAIYQTLKAYASKLRISSFVGGQFKERQKRNEITYLDKVENSNFISDFGGLNYSTKKGIFEDYKQYNIKQERNEGKQYTLSELRKTTQTDKELLNKVQNTLTEFFNGEIIIDKQTRYELVNFIEEYHKKYDNILMTCKALVIKDKSIHNKN